MKPIRITPVMSEKAYGTSQSGVYVFRAPVEYNKNEIKQAIEEQFGVTITNIKTLVQSGKAIRYSRGKRRYPGTTYRKDVKKAYVTLKEGDSIKVFDTEAPAEEKK